MLQLPDGQGATLASLPQLRNGESLTVRRRAALPGAPPPAPASATVAAEPSAPAPAPAPDASAAASAAADAFAAEASPHTATTVPAWSAAAMRGAPPPAAARDGETRRTDGAGVPSAPPLPAAGRAPRDFGFSDSPAGALPPHSDPRCFRMCVLPYVDFKHLQKLLHVKCAV